MFGGRTGRTEKALESAFELISQPFSLFIDVVLRKCEILTVEAFEIGDVLFCFGNLFPSLFNLARGSFLMLPFRVLQIAKFLFEPGELFLPLFDLTAHLLHLGVRSLLAHSKTR